MGGRLEWAILSHEAWLPRRFSAFVWDSAKQVLHIPSSLQLGIVLFSYRPPSEILSEVKEREVRLKSSSLFPPEIALNLSAFSFLPVAISFFWNATYLENLITSSLIRRHSRPLLFRQWSEKTGRYFPALSHFTSSTQAPSGVHADAFSTNANTA